MQCRWPILYNICEKKDHFQLCFMLKTLIIYHMQLISNHIMMNSDNHSDLLYTHIATRSILCSLSCPKLHRNFREYVTCKTVTILDDFFSFERRDKFFIF